MFAVRVILWTVAMAYIGFILTGQGLRSFSSFSITEAFLGFLAGLLLAIMFTLRERRRRQRPAFVAYSIAQIFPDWGTSRENRDSPPKPKR
jgi:membrane associated rhomboid family serine protease